MKRFLIIIINLILFVLLFHIVDFYVSLNDDYSSAWFYKLYKNENKLVAYLKHYSVLHRFSLNYLNHFDNGYNRYNNLTADDYNKVGEDNYQAFRPIENEAAINSILLFGCSYAYGANLSFNETFSALLGKQLPYYKIYNRSKCGWTTSHMLYQLENKDFSEYKNVKYIIYLFYEDHIIRNTDSYIVVFTPYYKLKFSNNLKFQKYSVKYMNSPLILLVKTRLKDAFYRMNFFRNFYYKNKNCYRVNLTKKILINSKLNAELKFPDAKFLILRFDRGDSLPYNWMFEDLKEKGFTVVSFNDLINKNYFVPEYQVSETNDHPNAKVWQEITPLFVKHLQDRGYLKD